MTFRLRPVRAIAAAAAGLSCLTFAPRHAAAQSLPAPVRVSLESAGHDDFAERLSDRMDPRRALDSGDVEDLLSRWERTTGGPSGDWDWLTVARLWLRAGDAGRASDALRRVSTDGLAPGLIALERARIGFLDGDPAAAAAYWEACGVADELSTLETWRDLEMLATPAETEAWDRFRRLPAGQRDDCDFLRRFWNQRASRFGVSTDERVALHYERLRFAVDHYTRRGRAQDVAGSGRFNARLGREGAPRFDDRGLLYLRLGPPDETARTIGSDCYEPNVTWFYRFPEENRLYHLSPLGGNDNWWLLANLGEIFRCPVDGAGNVGWDRNPMIAQAPLLDRIPGEILHDIYISRASLDPEYARMAHQFNSNTSRFVELLQDERDETWDDGRYAVADVPERPDVRMDVGLLQEWIAFRLPMPERTRIWLLLMVSGEDIENIDPLPEGGLEVIITALDERGRQEHVTRRMAYPDAGNDVVARFPLDLAPGSYETRVVVRAGPPRTPEDEDRSPPSGAYLASSLTVPQFDETLPRLSDIAVSPDSGGAWAQTSAVSLSPVPIHATSAEGRLWIYFEAYNLTPGGRYTAQVRLEPRGGGPSYDLEFSGVAQPEGRIVTPSGLRLDLADSQPGRYRLSLTVRDQATGRVTLPVTSEISIREP